MAEKLSLQKRLDKKIAKKIKKISSGMSLGNQLKALEEYQKKIGVTKKSRGGMITGNKFIQSFYDTDNKD